jgi:hypothetical protein
MLFMPSLRHLCAATLSVCFALAAASAPLTYLPLAHSALVVLEAARTPAGLSLRAQRASGTTALAAGAVSVSIDGHSVAVSANPDGSWQAAWPPGDATQERKVEVVLSHDGIREVLSGVLPATPGSARPPAGVLADHKQMAWWILNIAIVLIAVLAISRRMS